MKGETELALAEMRKKNPLFRAVTVRPGFVDAAAHDAIQAYIPTPSLMLRAVATVVAPTIRAALKSNWSPTQPMGVFMTEMAMGRWDKDKLQGPGIQRIGDFPVINNVGFRRLVGLDKS